METIKELVPFDRSTSLFSIPTSTGESIETMKIGTAMEMAAFLEMEIKWKSFTEIEYLIQSTTY
jgi:hypothetical protein